MRLTTSVMVSSRSMLKALLRPIFHTEVTTNEVVDVSEFASESLAFGFGRVLGSKVVTCANVSVLKAVSFVFGGIGTLLLVEPGGASLGGGGQRGRASFGLVSEPMAGQALAFKENDVEVLSLLDPKVTIS